MQENTVLLPSPNSAFTWTGVKRCSDQVCPSHSLRKRLMFGGDRYDGNDVSAEVEEVMKTHQNSFIQKWKCRCDVIVRCCEGQRLNPIKNSKIPKYDWSPIDKPASSGEPILDKFLESDDTSDAGSRPGSPIPFSPAHHCQYHSSSTSSSETSSCSSRIFTTPEPPEGCLTPPSSPNSPLNISSEVVITSNHNSAGEFNIEK